MEIKIIKSGNPLEGQPRSKGLIDQEKGLIDQEKVLVDYACINSHQ